MVLWAPKGGAGVTVVSVAAASVLGRAGGAWLVDLGGDVPGVIGAAEEPAAGVAEWLAAGDTAPADGLGRLGVEVSPGVLFVARGTAPLVTDDEAGARLGRALRAVGRPVVVDAGASPPGFCAALAASAGAVLVGVVRPCFLALRRAVGHPLLAGSECLVVVDELGRSLRPPDVARSLGRPVATTIRADAQVARLVDAGVLGTRLPDCLRRPVQRLLATAGQGPTGSAPAGGGGLGEVA